MKKILITGVAGFLGSHLAEKLLKMNHNVIGVDNMIGGYRDNVPKNIKFYKTGIDHGTITALINNKKFEVTSLRKDIITDGRHAKV